MPLACRTCHLHLRPSTCPASLLPPPAPFPIPRPLPVVPPRFPSFATSLSNAHFPPSADYRLHDLAAPYRRTQMMRASRKLGKSGLSFSCCHAVDKGEAQPSCPGRVGGTGITWTTIPVPRLTWDLRVIARTLTSTMVSE